MGDMSGNGESMAEAREGPERGARGGGGASLRIRLSDMWQGKNEGRQEKRRGTVCSERRVGGRWGYDFWAGKGGGRCWGWRARCCGGSGEHKRGDGGNCLPRYFVLLDLACIGTLPNSATRSTPSFLADERPTPSTNAILFNPTPTQSRVSKAPRDTASALAALSRQTPLVSNTRVPPSPPSTSFPPCVLSWRTLRRLKLAG